MPITDAEQYAIELLNRARLDPLGEATRQKVALNTGLPLNGYDVISTGGKQALAPHEALDRSATGHGNWMASTNTFSHTGEGGSTDHQRILAAGYELDSLGWKTGENLAMAAGIVTASKAAIDLHFSTLWNSPTHRSNMMSDVYREIGVAETSSGSGDFLTQNFGLAASIAYVTGVAYTDSDGDGFYSMGEGRSGLAMQIVGGSITRTAEAGGYGLSAQFGETVNVLIGSRTEIKVNLAAGNVKVDVVNGDKLLVSGNVTLVKGIADAAILGVGKVNLTGSGAANQLTGNNVRNVLDGKGGADLLIGLGGDDQLVGGAGNDTLLGGGGKDRLIGRTDDDRLEGGDNHDTLEGGAGNDTLLAGNGNDKLLGGTGADLLDGGNGNDLLQGNAGQDTLLGGVGDDQLDGGSENDLLEGGAGNDTLFGGTGADVLRGGAGKDVLNGGAGADLLIGGVGADSFVFDRNCGLDHIQGFSRGQGDRLVLDRTLLEETKLSATATGLTSKVLSQVATVTAEGVLLDLAGDNGVLLEGLTTTKGLLAYIDLF
ncbi:MAG: CAP domain-containing protein [Gemmobacter sp.]|jgi:Ca2+-binding RTX toxin-like protein|nr:CAP domain-containing protein [Gemmobacter sp.]